MKQDKDFAWQLFKNTGNLDAFMLMRECEFGEEVTPVINTKNLEVNDGNYKNKGNCN